MKKLGFVGFIYCLYLCLFYIQSSPNITLDIEKHQSLCMIDSQLSKHNLIPHRGVFLAYAVVTGHRSKLKAGEYNFQTRSLYKIAQKLIHEDVVLYKITIPEGSIVKDIISTVITCHPGAKPKAENPGSTKKHCMDPGFSILRIELQDDVSAPEIQEGALFPSTYIYTKHTSPHDIIKKMQIKMTQTLEKYHHPKLSSQELLILASVVEKETHLDHERALIASIFLKRLLKGIPLQADPSVTYGIEPTKKLTKADFSKKTPYNTYMYKGLPPTPICCPGEKSLAAVAQADETTPYLYFVVDGKDGHVFSKKFID